MHKNIYQLKLKGFHLNQLNKGIVLFLLSLKTELYSKDCGFDKIFISRIPKVKRNYTVIKSPDVNKSSREQFKIEYKALYLNLELKGNNERLFYLFHIFFHSLFFFDHTLNFIFMLKKKIKSLG